MADHTANVWWMSDESKPAEIIGEVTLKAGRLIGFASLDRVMRPMESLVWVESEGDTPVGVMATLAFNQ